MPTIFLDTETTGLDPDKCRITELAFLDDDGKYNFDEFIKIPKSIPYPHEVQEKTHIYPEMLENLGQPESTVAHVLHGVLSQPDTIMVAHNLHFDANFIASMFARNNLEMPSNLQYLDTLTVARDWLPIEHHRLENCIDFFKIGDKVKNSHRASDDTEALFYTFSEMFKYLSDKCDIERYINKIGYLPYFGAPKNPLPSVQYFPQDPKRGVSVYANL